MVTKIILVAILIFSMGIRLGGYILGKRKAGSAKVSLAVGLVLFFGTVVTADILLFSGHIYAADNGRGSLR